jgi:histidine triad (HIT) family protein
MNTNPNCIFCKIAKHEIPAHIVYEDDDFIAFLDIRPSAIGHTLLAPKSHTKWWLDLSESEINQAFNTAKKVAIRLKDKIGADFVRLNITGRDVPHFHIHLIPLRMDQENSLSKTFEYKDGEAEALIEKIKLNI